MRSSSSRSVAAAAALCCVLSACGSGTGTSASTPSVVTSTVAAPSPATSGTLTASPSGSYDPALVAEAEKVFREYQATFIKWQQSGGSKTLPPEFDRLSVPPIETDLAVVLAQQEKAGWRLSEQPAPRVLVQGPLPGMSMNGSVVAILGCVDASKAVIINADGTHQAGSITQYRAFFSGNTHMLRLVNEQNRQVKKC